MSLSIVELIIIDNLHAKRKCILICLLISISMCLNAQNGCLHDRTFSGEKEEVRQESLMINTAGDIEALECCDENALADFLNTSPEIARIILERQRSCDEEMSVKWLNKGHIVKVDYGGDLIPDSLSGIGRIICKFFSNNLGRYLFSNYWNGNGDVQLTVEQFAGILVCIKRDHGCLLQFSDTLHEDSNAIPVMVSFYNTQYEKEFGSATIFYNADGRVIGFSDVYDFDVKRWGIRPTKYELCIRVVALLSPETAEGFKISYNVK